MIEIWRDIPDYEDYYQVSDWGRVQSLDRYIVSSTDRRYQLHGRILSLQNQPCGHLTVGLSVAGVVKIHLVHRLVLEAFSGPCPAGCEGCHNDGNPSNNIHTNLRWGTRSENINDRFKHGYKGRVRPTKRSDGMIFGSIKLAAKHMEVHPSSIWRAMIHKVKCCDFNWEYI